MGIKPMTKNEYAKMIEAANACHDRPNEWHTCSRPWPIHHIAIGPIYMHVQEHPEGIKAVYTLLTCDDDDVTGDISGCTTVDEAKRSLNFSIFKAITVDRRYAAAYEAMVRTKLAAASMSDPAELVMSVAENFKPISGETAPGILRFDTGE